MTESSAQEIKWFMQYQGRIQGPFNTPGLQSTLERMESHFLEKTLVWRRGFTEWIKASKWQTEDHTKTFTQNTFSEKTQVSASSSSIQRKPTSTQAPQMNEGAFHRVQVNFVDQPLMTKNELLALIAKQEDISVIAIQDPQSKEWKEVYAFPDIIEKLGLSRRNHPRVPILAQFNGRTTHHENFHARVITISEGGLGLTEVHDLKIGDEVEGQITSPHFFQPINFQADVVYAGTDGYIGLRFNQINEESKASVIEYIKKFGKSIPLS